MRLAGQLGGTCRKGGARREQESQTLAPAPPSPRPRPTIKPHAHRKPPKASSKTFRRRRGSAAASAAARCLSLTNLAGGTHVTLQKEEDDPVSVIHHSRRSVSSKKNRQTRRETGRRVSHIQSKTESTGPRPEVTRRLQRALPSVVRDSQEDMHRMTDQTGSLGREAETTKQGRMERL